MAELTYRDAVAAAIAQEMARDESVVFLGEDIGAAGGVFKATVGLLQRMGVADIEETAIGALFEKAPFLSSPFVLSSLLRSTS